MSDLDPLCTITLSGVPISLLLNVVLGVAYRNAKERLAQERLRRRVDLGSQSSSGAAESEDS